MNKVLQANQDQLRRTIPRTAKAIIATVSSNDSTGQWIHLFLGRKGINRHSLPCTNQIPYVSFKFFSMSIPELYTVNYFILDIENISAKGKRVKLWLRC